MRHQVGLADRRPFLRHDHLDHELMRDLVRGGRGAGGGPSGIANCGRRVGLGEVVVELELDVRVGGRGVGRLPAREDGLLADDAGFGSGKALGWLRLGVAALCCGGRRDRQLGCVLIACWSEGLGHLFEPPRQLLELPVLHGADLGVEPSDPVQADLERVGARGVDVMGVVHVGLDVSGREDADGVVGDFGGAKGALDIEHLFELDGGLQSAIDLGNGLGLELVGDGSKGRVHACW